MAYKKDTISICMALYVILAMVSPSTGSILTKIGRVILIVGFLLTCRLKIRIPKESKKYILWSTAFLLYGVIGCFFAFSKTYATTYVVTLAYVIICDIVLALIIFGNKSYVQDMLYYIVWGATLKAAICYATNGFLCFLNSRATDNMSANTIGLYCAFAAIICWFISRNYGKPAYKALFLLNALFMLLSASRKAILFMMVPLAFMEIVRSKNPLNILKNILLAVVGMVLVFIALLKVDFLYTLIGYRIEGMINGFLGAGEIDASTTTRLGLIADGLTWFKENPIWGYGLSNFKALCAIYRSWGSVYYAHNNYVELLVDCGLVGTFIYYSLLIGLLIKGGITWKKLNAQQLMLLGMLLVMLICDYGMVTYFDIFSQLMYLLVYASLNRVTAYNTEYCLERNPIRGVTLCLTDSPAVIVCFDFGINLIPSEWLVCLRNSCLTHISFLDYIRYDKHGTTQNVVCV